MINNIYHFKNSGIIGVYFICVMCFVFVSFRGCLDSERSEKYAGFTMMFFVKKVL